MTALAPTRAATAAPRDAYRGRAVRHALALDGLSAVTAAFAAAPVAFWLAAGGLKRFTGVASATTQLGVLAGLVATALCALMFLLSARIPVVDRVIGHDRALVAHRELAAATFTGLGLHALLLTSGYAMTEHQGVVAQVAEFIGTPDWLLAILGLAGLLLVGASSFAAAKRRLGQEVWHAIHLLTYGSILLSLPHQFSSGLFSTEGPARWYWLAVWGSVGFATLTWRVLTPLLASAEARLRVVAVEPAGADAVSITVRGRHVERLQAQAGQFFHWRFLSPTLFWHQHPFSLSAAPTRDTLRITVRNLGKGSAALQRVRPGTPVLVEGPYGRFSDAARTTSRGLVLLGAGIGIAPIRAVLEGTDVPAGATTVVLRASTDAELYLVGEIAELCRRRGATLHVAVGPRARDGRTAAWLPATWTNHHLLSLAPQARDADVYVCGPQAWTDEVLADARRAGVPDSHLHDERFSW